MKLSCFILTKNNDKTIRYALESVHKYVDELIVVDSGSDDKTLDIVSKYTDKIFFNEFKNFSTQRNFAIKKCTKDWIYTLDADEFVGKNFPRAIKLVKQVEDRCRTVLLARYNLISIDPLIYITTKPHYQDWQVGFIKNDEKTIYDEQEVHSQLVNLRPRLKCGFGHVFHLDYLVKSHEMRKAKVDFYETKQVGAGYHTFYLFEDYPYRTAKTIEKPEENIHKLLLEDTGFFSYKENSNEILQKYHALKYKSHEILAYAKAKIL